MRDAVQRLMIQLRETALGHGHWAYDWWCVGGQKTIRQGVAESREEIVALCQQLVDESHGDFSVFVFPPPHRFHIRKLIVTKHQRRHMDKVLPYLMEPYLAQPIESIAFSWIADNSNQVWAMAVDKGMLEDWQAELQGIGVDKAVILPIQFVLTSQAQNGVAEILGEQFEMNNNQLCWLPKALASTYASTAIGQVYDFASIDAALTQEIRWRAWCFRDAKELSKGVKGSTYRWLIAAGAVSLALGAQWVNNYLATQALNGQASVIEQASEQLFLSLVPTEGRIVNLSRQLDAQLLQVTQQNNAPRKWSAYELLGKLGEVQKALTIEAGLQQVSLRQDVYRFEWLAPSRDELDRIQRYLEQQNIPVELVQWVRQGEQYLGVYRVQGTLN